MIKKVVIVGIAMFAMSGAVHADLITNGSFETTTNGNGQLGYNTNATAWTTTGYNFIFSPGTADVGGANGRNNNLKLWGPGDGSSNGLTTSPDGGNFVAADGAYLTAPLTQNITGLTVGRSYTVNFYWGAAQQSGFSGDTTDQWKVSLGSATDTTSTLSLPSHDFSGWQSAHLTYVATAVSETLSFLAKGTPNGEPPFALLDGVSMNESSSSDVPEPTALAWTLAALIVGTVFIRRRARVMKPTP